MTTLVFPRKGWVLVHRPSAIARGVTLVAGVLMWLIWMAVIGTALAQPGASTAVQLLGLAAGHTVSGLLIRAQRVQGLWIGPRGALGLATIAGVIIVPRDEVTRVDVGRLTGTVTVTTASARYLLELASRSGVASPHVSDAAEAVVALRDAGYQNVVATDAFEAKGPRVKTLELSFRGFGAVLSHWAVIATVALGQLFVLPALP